MANNALVKTPEKFHVSEDHGSGREGSREEWTLADERRVRRKLDFRLVPIVFLLYLLCFIDRANIGNARVLGMERDLGLRGYNFNWALTIFYISCGLVEIPSNLLLKIVGAQYYLSGLVVGFGIVSIGTAFVQDFSGLLACRFFLGVTEGGILPGIIFYLSCFYRKSELLFRIGLFANGASLSGAFGGLLAAGLVNVPRWGASSAPLHTWRNIFFFEGVITVIVGCVSMYFLPSTPAGCRFLSEQDQHIAAERIRRDHLETGTERVKWSHVWRAIGNINNWIYGSAFFLANVSVQSLSLFLPTILVAMGYTSIQAQLHAVPIFTVATSVSVVMAWLSDRIKRRGVFVLAAGLIAMSGYAMLVALTSPKAKYGAVFVAAIGIFFTGTSLMAWCLNNTAPQAVRAVSAGMIVMMANSGAFVATWTYLPTDAPRYVKGHAINLGAEVMVAVLALTGILYVKWENRQRDLGRRDGRLQDLKEDELADLGYRHPEFRYIE